MTIEEFCSDLQRELMAMPESEANEAVAAMIQTFDPPKQAHMSDCATSNAPAHMPGWCDCGATS